MIEEDDRRHGFDGARPAQFALGALLLLLAFLPPEVHGNSLAACAALVAIAFASIAPLPTRGGAALGLALAVPAALWIVRGAAAPGEAVEPVAVLLLAAAAGVAAARSGSGRPWTWAPWLLAIAGTGAGARALLDRLGGLESLRDAVGSGELVAVDRDLVLQRLADNRAYGGFSTPAALGGYLALCLPLTLGLALRERGSRRVALVALAALQGLGLLATASVTAAGALAVATVAFAVVRGLARTMRLAIAAGALLVVAILGAVALRGGHLLTWSDPESPWALRAGNVRIAVAMAQERPWVGHGPGGYAEAFPRFRRPGDNEARHAHSLPFELAADYGFPATVLLGALFAIGFVAPLGGSRFGGDPARRGAAVGLAAFAAHNLGDFTAFLPSTLWTASVVAGLVRVEAEPPSWTPPLGTADRAGRVGLSVAVAAVAVVSALSGLSADAIDEARIAIVTGDSERADAASLRAVVRAPWDGDAAMLRAHLLGESARAASGGAERFQEALAEADRAVALVPTRPAARALRARLRLATGDRGGAFADLTEAVRLYPTKTEYATLRDEVEAHLTPAPRPAETP